MFFFPEICIGVYKIHLLFSTTVCIGVCVCVRVCGVCVCLCYPFEALSLSFNFIHSHRLVSNGNFSKWLTWISRCSSASISTWETTTTATTNSRQRQLNWISSNTGRLTASTFLMRETNLFTMLSHTHIHRHSSKFTYVYLFVHSLHLPFVDVLSLLCQHVSHFLRHKGLIEINCYLVLLTNDKIYVYILKGRTQKDN